MMMKDLVHKCRSYRRFYQNEMISEDMLKELVDLGRMTASTANSQALKYKICADPDTNEQIFHTLGWAGALPDWDGPEEGERPSAYIVILCDLSLAQSRPVDDGIVAQTMMLGAVDMGYGGCILMNVQRTQLASVLNIDLEKYTIDLVLALGKPKENVQIVPIPDNGSVTYYRDENQVHYVPKRSLEQVLLP